MTFHVGYQFYLKKIIQFLVIDLINPGFSVIRISSHLEMNELNITHDFKFILDIEICPIYLKHRERYLSRIFFLYSKSEYI